jgi:hypothetical protein
MVYVTQFYPSLKPYLNGFHLSLETWQGGRNPKGWKERERQILLQVLNDQADPLTSDEVKLQQLIGDSPGAAPPPISEDWVRDSLRLCLAFGKTSKLCYF